MMHSMAQILSLWCLSCARETCKRWQCQDNSEMQDSSQFCIRKVDLTFCSHTIMRQHVWWGFRRTQCKKWLSTISGSSRNLSHSELIDLAGAENLRMWLCLADSAMLRGRACHEDSGRNGLNMSISVF